MSNANVAPLIRMAVLSVRIAVVGAIVAPRAPAQQLDRIEVGTAPSERPTMLVVGERLEYDVRFGKLRVGRGSMEVRETTDVRGREAWHTVFAIRGGIPFFRVDDRLESWIDTRSFTSVRFAQQTHEGRYHRERHIELYPERATMLESGEGAREEPTVDRPLDEGALLYYLRTLPLEVGDRYTLDRYFRPDRNPVRLEVLRRERIEVPAGTFETIVIRPTIRTAGIFSENGRAEVWVTDDERHLLVQMTAKLSFGTLHLSLREIANVAGTPLAPGSDSNILAQTLAAFHVLLRQGCTMGSGAIQDLGAHLHIYGTSRRQRWASSIGESTLCGHFETQLISRPSSAFLSWRFSELMPKCSPLPSRRIRSCESSKPVADIDRRHSWRPRTAGSGFGSTAGQDAHRRPWCHGPAFVKWMPT